jgi:hypothetical protein
MQCAARSFKVGVWQKKAPVSQDRRLPGLHNGCIDLGSINVGLPLHALDGADAQLRDWLDDG